MDHNFGCRGFSEKNDMGGGYLYIGRPSRAKEGYPGKKNVSVELALPWVSGKTVVGAG